MLKTTTINLDPRALRESMLAASRQVWLAGLGAAAVTREWMQHEAGHAMKSLVREGTAVESRAIRFVGDRIGASMSRANSVLAHTRRTVESTVRQAAGTTVALAQQVLPRVLPRALPAFESFVATTKPAARRTKKAAPVRKARVVKKTTGRKSAAKTTSRAR